MDLGGRDWSTLGQALGLIGGQAGAGALQGNLLQNILGAPQEQQPAALAQFFPQIGQKVEEQQFFGAANPFAQPQPGMQPAQGAQPAMGAPQEQAAPQPMAQLDAMRNEVADLQNRVQQAKAKYPRHPNTKQLESQLAQKQAMYNDAAKRLAKREDAEAQSNIRLQEGRMKDAYDLHDNILPDRLERADQTAIRSNQLEGLLKSNPDGFWAAAGDMVGLDPNKKHNEGVIAQAWANSLAQDLEDYGGSAKFMEDAISKTIDTKNPETAIQAIRVVDDARQRLARLDMAIADRLVEENNGVPPPDLKRQIRQFKDEHNLVDMNMQQLYDDLAYIRLSQGGQMYKDAEGNVGVFNKPPKGYEPVSMAEYRQASGG